LKHRVTVKGRHVFGISPPCIVSDNQRVDILEFNLDSEWDGYEQYSVIFHRARGEDIEAALDPDEPVVTVPAALIQDKGYLSFAVKATKCDGSRIVTASKCARIEVVQAGVMAPYDPDTEELTLLEQRTLEAKQAAETADASAAGAGEAAARANASADSADAAAQRANDAAEAAEHVGDKNYDTLLNKPSIENVTLQGNRRLDDFGMSHALNQDILNLF